MSGILQLALLASDVVERVVDLTLGEPPGDTTHWTGRAMAQAAAISLRSVQRICRPRAGEGVDR